MERPELTIDALKKEAALFATLPVHNAIAKLYGVSDGKAVGTHVESAFLDHLEERYQFPRGNAARDIDIPGLNVDIKTTSIRQPQSSAPFRNIEQRVFGLGYALLVFAYEKSDDVKSRAARLRFDSVTFVEAPYTADHRATREVDAELKKGGDEEDIFAVLADLTMFQGIAEDTLMDLARKAVANPPRIGVLTFSNANQWRIGYKKAIAIARSGGNSNVVALV